MIHYILNTGQTYHVPRLKVADGLKDKMQEYMRPGAYKLPVPGNLVLDVKDTRCGYAGTVFWGETALVAFSVADTLEAASYVWPGLEKMYLEITDRGILASEDYKSPTMPTSFPWLSVVVVNPVYSRSKEATEFLRVLERRLAWTWLQRQ